MKLFLLLWSLVVVVWPLELDSNLQEQYHNLWTPQASADSESCFHDGFSSGSGGCLCKGNFIGDKCKTRKCLNGGRLRIETEKGQDYGCFCPPGFLGTSCEPVKCLSGESKSFKTSSTEKTLSAVLTWNTDLAVKVGEYEDNPITAICHTATTLGFGQVTVVVGYATLSASVKNATQCFNDIHNYIEYGCDPNGCAGTEQLLLSQISGLLDSSTPGSLLYIVTNLPLQASDSANLDGQNEILRVATANRITINVFAYAPEKPVQDTVYTTDVGFQALQYLADGTLGSYVTPYHAFAKLLFGNANVSAVMTKLANLRKETYGIVAKLPASSVLQLYDLGQAGDKFYIIFRSNEPTTNAVIEQTAQTFDQTLLLDTGFWKMYQCTITADGIQAMQVRSTGVPFSYYLVSKRKLTTYTAVTTTDGLKDATSPYALNGTSASLVAKVSSSIGSTSPDILSVNVLGQDPLQFQSNISTRNCQFSFNLGSITCQTVGPVIVSVKDDKSVGSATPFMCVDSQKIPDQLLDESFLLEEQSSSTPNPVPLIDCTPSSDLLKKMYNKKRSFSIISRNSSESMQNLYVKPRNVFEYLVPFMESNPDFYDYFITNIINDQSLHQSWQFDNFPDSLSKVMNGLNDRTNDSPVNWTAALRDSKDLSDMQPFSDIFMVIDDTITTNITEPDVLTTIHQNRLRVFIIVMNGTNEDGYIRDYTDLAVKSGGALLTVNYWSQISEFFEFYFGHIAGADVVYEWVNYNPSPFISTQEGIWLRPEIDYWLFVQADGPATSATISNATSPIPAKLVATYGKLTIFRVNVQTPDLYNIKAALPIFPPSSEPSMILFAPSSKDITNLAFTDSRTKDETDGDILFGITEPRYPVIQTVGEVQSFKIADSVNRIVSNSNPMQRNNATCSFNYLLDLNFVCKQSNKPYYFTTVVNYSSYNETRTQLLTCIHNEQHACLNGGQHENGRCSCQPGWEGFICETPICQNGGTVTTSDKCDCSAGYTGNFCELAPSNQTCQQSPSMPHFTTEITSILIVIDKQNPVEMSHTNIDLLPGVQIVVVQYDCNGAGMVLSTTDVTLLGDALVSSSPSPTCAPNAIDNSLSALDVALDSQLTDRAILVWVTGSDHTLAMQSALQNRLAQQRVDIRIVTNKQPSTDMLTVAQLGNGVPLVLDTLDWSQYWAYIGSLFSTALSSVPPHLTVIQSGTGNSSVSIAADGSTTTLYVHTLNAIATIQPTQTEPPIVGTAGNSITKYTSVTLNQAVSVKVSCKSDDVCWYSVERLTATKIAYGFQIDGTAENLNNGLTPGSNMLSLYITNLFDGDTVANMPSIQLTPIVNNGTRLPYTLSPTTRKSSNCTYSYYSSPINCERNISGFQAQIFTRPAGNSGIVRQDQTILACSTQTKGTVGPPRAFAFILDTSGTDESLFNTTMITITEFVSLYDLSISSILLVDNNLVLRFPFEIYTNLEKLHSKLSQFWNARKNESKGTPTDLSRVFDYILVSAKNTPEVLEQSDFSTTFKNIFYLTQQGAELNNTNSLTALSADYFITSSIAVHSTWRDFNVTMKQQLAKLGAVHEATDWTTAVNYMQNDTNTIGTPYTAEPGQPTQRVPACVNGLQATIYVAFQASNVTGLAEYKKQMLDFVSLFPTDFALTAGTMPPNNNNCYIDTNTPIFQDKTSISGWVYLDETVALADNSQPQFCQPNFNRMDNPINAAKPKGPVVWGDKIVKTLAYYLDRSCACDRRNDTNTEKIIIWLPLTDDTSEYDISPLTDTVYQHYVLPMGFDTVTENSKTIYDQLLRSNVDKNKTIPYSSRLIPKGNTASEMVESVWTSLCRNAGLISDDATAEPPASLEEAEQFNREFWPDYSV